MCAKAAGTHTEATLVAQTSFSKFFLNREVIPQYQVPWHETRLG
jgi:hypothetical protein